MREAEEKEQREAYLESIGDVTKQQDLSGFYRHIYSQKLGDEEKKVEESESKKKNYRKRKSSDDEEEMEVEQVDKNKSDHLVSNLDADSDFSIESSDSEKEEEKEEKVKVKEEDLPPPSTTTELPVPPLEIKKEEIKEESPPKEKIDIWKKRTVGDVFDQALQRYFERKALREAA